MTIAKSMRIGQLADTTGVPVETIRFYEAKGLLPEPMRLPNNYRVYGPAHVQRLVFIRNCRSLDIGLDDIGTLLHYDTTDEEQAKRVHAFVDEQVSKVTQRIAELEHLREALLALPAACHGHGPGQTCGIMHRLNASDEHDACHACHAKENETCNG